MIKHALSYTVLSFCIIIMIFDYFYLFIYFYILYIYYNYVKTTLQGIHIWHVNRMACNSCQNEKRLHCVYIFIFLFRVTLYGM